ncbi:MAG: YdcF family protein [Deltaproteobacteria bacterium]|nr:YdcF family protein [Deltaproteobacteria bacterium]
MDRTTIDMAPTRRWPAVLLSVVVAASLVLAGGGVRAGKPKEPPQPKDPSRVGVIIALGFGHEQEARASHRMVQRVGAAVQMYREGRAKYILFCGGYTSGHVAEAEVMKILAMAMGVPERAILLENGSISTVQNARNAERIVQKKRFRSALLVTHRNHMNRAYKEFRKVKGLRSVHRHPADDWVLEPQQDNLDQELPPAAPIQAVVVHGRSEPVDFLGDTVTLDRTQASLARTMALIYQRGFTSMPYHVWHSAVSVGHVTRAEIIGIAASAFGLPSKVLELGASRRFAPGKLGLFETCKARGWTRVLAVLPREREEEVELMEQQYLENGIVATVILAASPPGKQ